MSQEEGADLELFLQQQIEQEHEDEYDVELFHEHQQHEKTIREEDETECCPGHEYEFLEQLDCTDDYVRELWNCLICNKTRVFTKRIGVRDD